MRNATLRQLRTFAEVARRLSFTAAAKALHLTQPAVSMQVRQLEEAAGLPLVEQLGRRVHLTDAGRELLRYAGGIADLMREAEEAMKALQGIGGGELSIAVTSTAKYFAPRLLAEFRRRHPEVRLRLAVSNREAVVRALTDNAVDLAVMGRPPRGLDTDAAAFAKHPIAVIAAPDHPLAGRRRLPLEALAGETFIIRERGSGTRAAMEHVFAERSFRARETMEMSSNETIKQAVMAGMGIAFLSTHTIGLELRAGRLVLLAVSGLPVMREWYVIHRRGKRLSPAAQAFKSFLLEQGAALIERAVA
ncbi:MAG TPA: LysR family transcriptional regulator [Burkholderiales bacterium]|nr:LysR family transcriptional regulator [Burkholderiales bacterium]